MDEEYLSSHLLGSGGKKDTSGDLDINVDETRVDISRLTLDLNTLLGEENVKSRPGNNQIFTSIPIQSTKGGRVQIDFMFGDTVWQEFSYWSSQTSAFKGLYRTELIKAMVAFKSDWVLEENGEMVARVGPTFFHDRGIVWRYRHRPFKKDGESRIKQLKELTREEFLEIYPEAKVAREGSVRDPQVVMRLILPQSTYDVHDSFESLWNAVIQQYEKCDRDIISKIYLERLNSLKAEVPKEIKDALVRNY